MRRRVVAVSLSLLIAPTGSVARADHLIPTTEVTGTVTNILGSPISAAQVGDGRRAVLTDGLGRYSIPETLGSSFLLTASKVGYEPRSRGGIALPGTVIDFTLRFSFVDTTITPTTFETVPQTLALKTATAAPTAGTCVTATDITLGNTVSLSPGETRPDGTTLWTGSLNVPESIEVGIYEVHFRAFDCASGAPLTPTVRRWYVFDQAAPQVTISRPAVGHSYVADVDTGESEDGRTTVTGAVTFVFDVSDDVAASVSIRLVGLSVFLVSPCDFTWTSPTSRRFSCGPQFFPQTSATYTFQVDATDLMGRVATASRSFDLVP